MPKRKNYIPASQFWKDIFSQPQYRSTWKVVEKVPIRRIKVDKSVLTYNNEVDPTQVLAMLVEFDPDLWMPITVNETYCLLDGQHRLRVAEQLCLKYIDVVIEHEVT